MHHRHLSLTFPFLSPSEPAISSPNCPRQYGIFADDNNCNTFWSCWAGESNKYECPPGLAYDSAQRVCVWADQVKACKKEGKSRRRDERSPSVIV